MSPLRFPQINQVAVCGRLCQDPEFRYTETGKARVTFNLAVNLGYKDREGQWQQDTTFVSVVVWDKLAEAIAENLQKGSGVFLTGRLKSRKYETGNGSRSILEIVARSVQFLDKKEAEPESQEEKEPKPPSDEEEGDSLPF